MTVAMRRKSPEPERGRTTPRIAPPTPARSLLADYKATAAAIGIDLIPWQETAARYITAQGQGTRWLYREVAIVVARQNGKTQLLIPLIVMEILKGKRVMHTAQDRTLPREVFDQVSDIMVEHYKSELVGKIRLANGQESIKTRAGGRYRIVAPTRGGARGPTNDLVIVDELREMDDFAFIAAAKPTLTVSKSPQMLYLSNAGTESSIVLNALRKRADSDPVLGYLEWSAAPDRPADDHVGWLESNPSIGYERGEMGSIIETLEDEYRTATLEGTLGNFETEHLCRWVATLRERLVDDREWLNCRGPLGKPLRAALGVALDPDGKRASIALAWRVGGVVALTLVSDEQDVNVDTVRDEVTTLARKYGAEVGHDPLTDAVLVRGLAKGKAKPVNGPKFASASAEFARRVSLSTIRWADADAVTDDLTWTARKPDGEQGGYHAVRAKDDRPITAALAAIRAVSLVSVEPPSPPRIR